MSFRGVQQRARPKRLGSARPKAELQRWQTSAAAWRYNENVRLLVLRTALNVSKQPPSGFEEVGLSRPVCLFTY